MGKNIVLGISGGIAAYKAANICSMLRKKGHNVKVIMTENATKIIKPLALETLSKNPVAVDMWEPKTNINVEHISLADWADVMLIAPATYNIIGKVASGIADDMLSTVISATTCPVYFAVAMNVNMYNNPILRDNIKKLESYGYNFIDSDEGFLACNWTAKGRLKKEEDIVSIIEESFKEEEKILEGKNIIITAGKTEEQIDPVRIFTNRSTGKMGYSLAKIARDLGANVTLISGPTNLTAPSNIEVVNVKSALEMYEATTSRWDSMDIGIACAAVADYRIKEFSENKIKKADGSLTLEFVRNPDILAKLGELKSKSQKLIGFAAESENLIENATNKLKRKNLDMIVGNSVKYFESTKNMGIFIKKNGEIKEIEELPKEELAKLILNEVSELI